MCGIAGIIDLRGSREINRAALKRMTDALAHRGPDGEGFFVEDGVGFGHRRLAIIDIAGGVQPMRSASGGGVLIFNGEIYNYRELAREFAQKNVSLRTNSDSEVLVEGLHREGRAYIEKLRGMYAFAYWNRATKTLTLARDRFGEKPLYYCETPEGFLLFASEIGALRAAGLVEFDHATDAVADYFLYGYVPEPKSIYRQVRRLEPGTALTAAPNRRASIHRYWRPVFDADRSMNFKTAQGDLLDLLDDAVAAQRVADVPLGAFLSGGVDSSAIVSSMALKGGEVRTCTIGFDDAKADEREAARRTAARYKTEHSEEVATLEVSGLIDRIAAIYGEPFADPSAIPTYLVCGAARRHVTVALSGDGGDEIFGGYRRYRMFAAEDRWRRAMPASARAATFGALGRAYPKLDWAPRPLRFKTTFQALGEDNIGAYARAVSASLPDRALAMMSRDLRRALGDYDPVNAIAGYADDDLDALSQAQMIDLHSWLPGRMLTKVDRAAMAHGLEVRAPFLDHRLAEWAFRLPPQFRASMASGKRILKAALAGRVDKEILHAPKRGFSPPVAAWLRDAAGPLRRLENSSYWRDSGALDETAVTLMVERHAAGAADYSQELWAVIMFDAFLRTETGVQGILPAAERFAAQ
jgi:asparagine synthase (glutamine-hydrolysing)